jgi:nucleoside-diphosphate-sugar epimerase
MELIRKYESRTLLVGAAGYLGGAVTDALLKMTKKENLLVYDSLLYEDQYLKDIPFQKGDVRDWQTLKNIIPNFDVVIWLAAIVGDASCEVNRDVTIAVNEEAVFNLASYFPNKKIILTSTASVYGANKDGTLNEQSPTNPLSLYAGTKLNAEKYLKEKCEDFFILRLGTLFGIGDSYARTRFDLVVNRMTADAVTKGELSVFGGSQWRPLVHVRSVGDFIAKLALWSSKDKSGVYNLNHYNMTIKDLAHKVSSYTGCNIKQADQKCQDLRDYRISSSRALIQLAFNPQITIDEGIKEIIKIIKEGRIKDVNSPKHSNHAFLQAHPC